jgi:hypothetical protein
MADIAQKITSIREAIHGKEVRESLASGLEAINGEAEYTTARQNQVEQDFSNIKTGEENRAAAEDIRIANEEIRQTNETARVKAENTRLANETIREKIINNFKSFGDYSPDTTYNQYNTVTHNYSTYMCIADGTKGIEPTQTENWIVLAIKGQDGTGGDMFKLYYDSNGDNKVNEADSADGIKHIPVDISNIDSNYVLKYDKTKNVLKAVPEDYVIDNTPPGTVSNFMVLIGNAKLSLSWANPSDADFAGVKVIRKEGGYPEFITDGAQVYDGTDTSYVDEGLTNDTTYYYRAFTYDTSQNYNDAMVGQQVSGTPKLNAGITPPGPITSFVADAGNAKVDLSWANPTDEDFVGVKIRRQTVGYPTTIDDGIEVYNGSATSFEDTTVENGTTYYYRAFPYDTAGNYNTTTEGQQISAKPVGYKVYGVRIDTTNSNPETAVTYTDDAVNMSGGSADWDSMAIFKDIKPCVLKNGVVQYYLNPNDFTKKADGSAADITSGNDGDVMIEIPKTGFKIATSGNTLTIKVTDNPNAGSDGFKYYAHTRSTEGDREKLYIGAYLGYSASNKLRSLSGKTPYAGGTAPAGTIGTCRTLAQANGTGYDQVSFFPLTLLQCLFLIKYKNRDSQTALGRGYVDGNSASIATGGTNTKGMFFGETTGKQQMKFLGIEDMWGNLRWWIDGLFSDASRNIFTAFDNFNDTGSGYTSRGQGATTDIGNYMSKPQGTSETGFVAKEVNGSATTYFTDSAYLYASRLPSSGGDWNNADDAGVFYLNVNYSTSYSNADLGGRLMYL